MLNGIVSPWLEEAMPFLNFVNIAQTRRLVVGSIFSPCGSWFVSAPGTASTQIYTNTSMQTDL